MMDGPPIAAQPGPQSPSRPAGSIQRCHLSLCKSTYSVRTLTFCMLMIVSHIIVDFEKWKWLPKMQGLSVFKTWITVVFRSNDSCCLLCKFSAIRVTRWLLWHPNCIKFNFGWGSALDPAGGAYDAPPGPLVGWGGGNPLPIFYPLDPSTPSALNPRRLRRLDSNPPLRISGYATGLYCITYRLFSWLWCMAIHTDVSKTGKLSRLAPPAE